MHINTLKLNCFTNIIIIINNIKIHLFTKNRGLKALSGINTIPARDKTRNKINIGIKIV